MTDSMRSDDETVEHVDSRAGRSAPVRILSLSVAAAVVLGAVALGFALDSRTPVAAAKVACSSTAPKLTVQGTGQATVTPDLLTVSVEVDTSGSSAAAALSANTMTTQGAVAAFKGGGVDAKDIATSGLSLQPQYIYPKGVPTLTGYQVANSITATIRTVAGAGSIIDAVVGAGGNALKINAISFSVAHPGTLDNQARSRAVSQAVAHAKAMATAAGRTLGPVCSLSDQTQLPLQSQNALSYADSGEASAATPVPIEAGSQTESAQISLTYLLEPPRR
jgi:uncharacterized protein